MKPCCVYVDGDNQPASLAVVLMEALTARGLYASAVQIFGNVTATRPQRWHDELAGLPAMADKVTLHRVPCHREAADAALILSLGAKLDEHMVKGEHVVIVSRDNSLLACAERIQHLGCPTLVCHAAHTPSNWDVPTLALDVQAPAAAGPDRAVPAHGPRETTPSLVHMLRRQAIPCPGGGYRKSCVGSLLRRAGLDRAGRAAFLASLPGLRETPIAGDHALHF